MIDIGAEIRVRREKLGWSQQKLATLAGITASFLSRLERGKTYYSRETIIGVCGALGISVESLYASQSNVVDAPKDWRSIPVLDYRQAATWIVDSSAAQLGQHETIMTNLEHPPSTFALKIRGDSMEPEFYADDVVVIDPTILPRAGDYVVATDQSGEATFKEYRDGGINEKGQQVFVLHPLNPRYAPMHSDRQKLAIVGTMVERRSYRKC